MQANFRQISRAQSLALCPMASPGAANDLHLAPVSRSMPTAVGQFILRQHGKPFDFEPPVSYPIASNQSHMGSLKKRRKAKINKHKRRKKLRMHRHKKRTWQK
jgi:hypothetical protein